MSTPRTQLAIIVAILSLAAATTCVSQAVAESYVVSGFHDSATRHSVSVADYAWFDAGRSRTIPARVYYPDDAAEQFPVVIFSTGLGRSKDDCSYLGRHWASCGYVAVHVQHKGSDNDAARGLRTKKELQQAFYAPNNIRNRPMDIIFVIDQLDQLSRDGSPVGSRLDMDRIGVSGHDFGAQTAMAIAGQVLPGRIAFAEHRVKAVVAMSAPVPVGQVPLPLAYGDISLPCLYITGTADNSIVATTTAPQRRLPFDYSAGADEYLVTFYGADHLMYSGGAHDAAFQRQIAECSTAFWDAYLKDDARAKEWLADEGIKTQLGSIGWVERKLVSDKLTRTAQSGD